MARKLLVAVPSHNGGADGLTIETLLQLQRAALNRGDAIDIRLHGGSMIPVLRNLIVADFLQSEADTLVMIDADQGLGGETLMRMIDHSAPVVGCLYPRRRYDWSQVRRGEPDLERTLYQASSFVGSLAASDGGGAQVEVKDGFARADFVGSGALVIRRAAVERMIAAYPDLAGEGFSAQEFAAPRFAHNWGFFNPLSKAEAGQVLSEDFSFCWRWRRIGGKIWAEVASVTAHAGRHVFAGAYIDYLRALSPRAT